MQRVIEIAEPAIRARRRDVHIGGHAHAERLMRSLAVVAIHEGIAARLRSI
jgi:hypothetical protein